MKTNKSLIIFLVFLLLAFFSGGNVAHSGIFKTATNKICKKLKSFTKGKGVGKTTGGSSTVLASRIGIAARKGWAAHHIIPVQLKNHRVLKKIGMDMDEIQNGIALPTKPGLDSKLPLHRGSHPSYTAAVAEELDKIPADASIEETRILVKKVQQKFRNKLKSGKPLHEKYGASDSWY